MFTKSGVEIQADYVVSRCGGTYGREAFRRFLREAVAACARENRKRLLLDVREVSGYLSTMDRYDLALDLVNELGKAALPTLRVVFAVAPSMIDPERFGEKVARNRGANVRVTVDREEGLAWLLGGTP